MPPQKLSTTLLLACGAMAAERASAQTVEYDVVPTGTVPGAYITFAQGMNDHGVVVGMAMFIPGGLKGWTWTEGAGFTLLPDPPGQSDFGAVDINNAGVIAGDGGGDSGQPWRYDNGVYEMLGVLPGTAFARTTGISELGSVTGTCYGTLFYTPHHSFLAVKGAPNTSILDDSYANAINASDQVAGEQGWDAYRYTPGLGMELLPPLGDRDMVIAYGINDAGHVVGYARSAKEHSEVPFLFTDAAGIQEVGSFPGRAFAVDVNDSDEIVGEWEPAAGNRKPWVWSATRGVRYLQDVIDPALGLKLHDVHRINASGQVLCTGYDQNNDLIGMLLTPLDLCPGATQYCGAAQNPNNGAGIEIDTCDSAASNIRISLSGGPPGQFTYLLVGDGNVTVTQPPGANGDLCVSGGACLGRYDQDAGPIDGFGAFTTDVMNALSNPCGGAVTIGPGSSWNFQYWHRQPMGQPSTFSEAIAVTFH